MSYELKRALILSTRRLIAFLIDFFIVLFTLLLIEGFIGLFLAHFTQYDTRGKANQFISVFNGAHVLIIPIMLGIGNSILFDGQSIGSKLVKLKVFSLSAPWMSVEGCILRSFLLLGPPYLYLNLIFIPYVSHNVTSELQFPFLEFATLIWFLLIMPISIIAGRGQQGLHDWILSIRVAMWPSPQPYKKFTQSSLSVFAFLTISVVVSGLLAQFIQNNLFMRRTVSLIAPVADRFQKKPVPSGVGQAYYDLKGTLDPDKYSDLTVLLFIGMTPIKFEDSDITIPAYIEITDIRVSTCEAGINRLKEATLAIGKSVQHANLKSKFFRITLSRDIDVGIIRYALSSECFYQNEIEKPLDCHFGIGAGLRF